MDLAFPPDGSESAPAIRGNSIHDTGDAGIAVDTGAIPAIVDIHVWGARGPGVLVEGLGSRPQIIGNRIHDGENYGNSVRDGATPRIEVNEIWANAKPGIEVAGDAHPLVSANTVID